MITQATCDKNTQQMIGLFGTGGLNHISLWMLFTLLAKQYHLLDTSTCNCLIMISDLYMFYQ